MISQFFIKKELNQSNLNRFFSFLSFQEEHNYVPIWLNLMHCTCGTYWFHSDGWLWPAVTETSFTPFSPLYFSKHIFIAILNFFLILPYTFRYFLILITRSHSFTNFITLYNTVSYCLILSHTCSYFLLVAHILSFFPTVHYLTIKSVWHCHATVLKPVQYRTPLLLWFRVQSS